MNFKQITKDSSMCEAHMFTTWSLPKQPDIFHNQINECDTDWIWEYSL